MNKMELAQYIYDEFGVKDGKWPPAKVVGISGSGLSATLHMDNGRVSTCTGKFAVDIHHAQTGSVGKVFELRAPPIAG